MPLLINFSHFSRLGSLLLVECENALLLGLDSTLIPTIEPTQEPTVETSILPTLSPTFILGTVGKPKDTGRSVTGDVPASPSNDVLGLDLGLDVERTETVVTCEEISRPNGSCVKQCVEFIYRYQGNEFVDKTKTDMYEEDCVEASS